MALIELMAAGAEAAEDREAVESGRQQYGQLLETWRALLHRPGLFSAYLPFLRRVAGPGVLDTRIKELTATYVAALNGCRYTLSHRAASAARNDVPESAVVDAVREEWEAFTDSERAALTVARQLTTQPTVVPYDEQISPLTPQARADLRAHFSDGELVELLLSISMWNGLARFHRVMEFDLDMAPAPEAIDPEPPQSTTP